MSHRPTYYELLGVTPQAPLEIIQAVYRAWMKALKVHPDLGGDEELAKKLNEAYETLKDPKKRLIYNASLRRDEPDRDDEVRRRAYRRRVDVDICFSYMAHEQWLKARALDASVLGLRLRIDRKLGVGDHLAIAFPDTAEKSVEATVRWWRLLQFGDQIAYEVGVEFFEPVPDIFQRLTVSTS